VSRTRNTHRVDDLDGSTASQTVLFSIDHEQFEIDLNDDNAALLRDVFTPYIAAARPTRQRRHITSKSGDGKRREDAGSGKAPSETLAPVVALQSRRAAETSSGDVLGPELRNMATEVIDLLQEVLAAVKAALAEWIISLLVEVRHLAGIDAPIGQGAGGRSVS
jgi:Lsr2 protein